MFLLRPIPETPRTNRDNRNKQQHRLDAKTRVGKEDATQNCCDDDGVDDLHVFIMSVTVVFHVA